MIRIVTFIYTLLWASFVYAASPIYVAASGGDDAPAINAAFITSGGSVQLGCEPYKQATLIIVPTNAKLSGQGRCTVIKKIANGDMLELGYGASITDLILDGDGSNYTGRGIVIRANHHYQTISKVHINSNDYPLHFESPDAGSNAIVENCFITRWPSLLSYSIKLPDDISGGNRTFRNVQSSGGAGIDNAGAYNTILDRVNMAYIAMNDNSRTFIVVNSRLGYAEWKGLGHWVGFNNYGVQNFITPTMRQGQFITGPMNQPFGRQDPPANANIVW